MPLRILGLGNPLLDITATVDQAFLDKYEIKAADACLATEKQLPMYPEMQKMADVQYIPGGSTLNTIRVANWQLGLSGQTGLTGYMGAIGRDEYGTILTEKAGAEGVKMVMWTSPETPTGTCAVGILDRERALCANLGAASLFPTSHLDTEDAKALVQGSAIVYSAGFFFLTNGEAIARVAKQVDEAGARFALNLSAPFIIGLVAETFNKVYQHTSFIFCNETEAEAWRAQNADGFAKDVPENDTAAIAVALANIPGRTDRVAVVTQGSKATCLARGGEKEAQVIPVPAIDKEHVLDTNGAGDAFVGGFLAALSLGKELQEAVAQGNAAARVVIQNSSCQWANTGV